MSFLRTCSWTELGTKWRDTDQPKATSQNRDWLQHHHQRPLLLGLHSRSRKGVIAGEEGGGSRTGGGLLLLLLKGRERVEGETAGGCRRRCARGSRWRYRDHVHAAPTAAAEEVARLHGVDASGAHRHVEEVHLLAAALRLHERRRRASASAAKEVRASERVRLRGGAKG